MIDILADPDWPLAMSALAEANGWEVERILLAEDVWMALAERVPRAEATSATHSPLAAITGVPISIERALSPGDGYAVLRNGRIQRIFGRRAAPGNGADARKGDE